MIRPNDPAFPKPDTVESKDCHAGDFPRITEGASGMDLRTYLAGQALIGLLAYNPGGCDEPIAQMDAAEVALEAVAYADALIGALNR